MPEKMREGWCASIKEYVDMLERNSEKFYAYPEAIMQIECELYGMPLFNEGKKEIIASYYQAADEMFEHYNNRIRMFTTSKMIQKWKSVTENLGSYTAKKPVPSKELVDELIGEIMGIVDAEMEMLGK